MKSTSVKKAALLTGGCISLGVAVIGLFVPVLPTTPLLLVALWCFLRSSPRMHARLLAHPVLGAYVRDYVEHRAIRRGARRRTLALLWLSLGVSALLIDSLHVRVVLAVVGIGVTFHLLRLHVLDPASRPSDAAAPGRDTPEQESP
ncbi:MAG: DUF454 domain-containing protein [Clostridiaceae bacterium]|jgi:uncharacterized membrane protein YbaN (DUF454 family)|nr:DUF454 domain-containing protein [Clostridiaceae bacterium]